MFAHPSGQDTETVPGMYVCLAKMDRIQVLVWAGSRPDVVSYINGTKEEKILSLSTRNCVK